MINKMIVPYTTRRTTFIQLLNIYLTIRPGPGTDARSINIYPLTSLDPNALIPRRTRTGVEVRLLTTTTEKRMKWAKSNDRVGPIHRPQRGPGAFFVIGWKKIASNFAYLVIVSNYGDRFGDEKRRLLTIGFLGTVTFRYIERNRNCF